jgi:eukaryotic-like serine/threonine-protein kinase
MGMDPPAPGKLLAGRYLLYEPIASGGMATVHYGRLVATGGFSRAVAIKRLHPALATDPDFLATFLDEARIAARVRHPNVVSVLDVVSDAEELFLVMEYVHGETLARLVRAASQCSERVPLPVSAAIVSGVLHGLHAAHEATNEEGEPLGIVHRDVSPQNVLIGTDGAPHLVDFGIAKAIGRTQTTRDGQLKGKLPYMAVEQLRGQPVSRRTDVYAACVVLWELLTGERMFQGEDAAIYGKVLDGCRVPPIELVPELPPELDALVMRGLSLDPEARHSTARGMALELERIVRPATASEVGSWVAGVAGEVLEDRARRLSEIESKSGVRSVSQRVLDERPSSAPADTQVSSISVTRPSEVGSRRPRRLALWAGGAGAVVIATLLALSSLSRSPRMEEATAPAAPALPEAAPAPAAPAASVPAAPSASAPASVARPRSRAPARAPTKAPSKGPGCKYLGADGIWHIRPECL